MYNQKFNNFGGGFNGFDNGQKAGYNSHQPRPAGTPRQQEYPIVSKADEYVCQTWKNMIDGAKTMLDTCALMAYRVENVKTLFQQLIYPLYECGVRFYIVEETWIEIDRLANSAEKVESGMLATEVRRFLEASVRNGVIEIISGVTANPSVTKNGHFADPSILSYAFDQFTHNGKLCVITRDNKLAVDLRNICQAGCVDRNMGAVRVLYLDTRLRLKEFQNRNSMPIVGSSPRYEQSAPVGYAGDLPANNSYAASHPMDNSFADHGFRSNRPAYNGYTSNRPAYNGRIGNRPAYNGYTDNRAAGSSCISSSPADNRTMSEAIERDHHDEFEKASTDKGCLTTLSSSNLYDGHRGMKAPATKSVVTMVRPDGTSTKVTLGERIGGGKEGGIYRIQGDEYRDYCVKIFDMPSTRIEKKVELMMSGLKPSDEYARPLALVHSNSVFCGYVMALYKYAITLADLYEGKAGTRADNFTRVDYVTAAYKYIKLWSDLDSQGVRIVDFNPNNLLFVPQNGEYTGAKLVIVDLDSAQVDTAKLGKNFGVIPAGGFCEGMIDYTVGKFTVDTILSESNMVMGLAEAMFKMCCVGLHPYDVVPKNGPDMTLDQNAELGAYLYTRTYPKLAGYTVPDASVYMVSYMTPGLKGLFADLFHARGKYRNVDNRPSVKELMMQVEYYANDIRTLRTQQKFPESIALQPTNVRQFKHTCQGTCGNTEELVLHDTLFKVNNRFYCKACADKARQAGANGASACPEDASIVDQHVQRRSGVFGWLPNRKGA